MREDIPMIGMIRERGDLEKKSFEKEICSPKPGPKISDAVSIPK